MEKAILGIDVSKKELVVAMLLNDKKKIATFANNSLGHKKLHKWVIERSKGCKVLACAEATGSYSEQVAEYLYLQGYEVSIVNPFCIKSFANSRLTRHKNDQVDAAVIAEYAKVQKVQLYKPTTSILKEFKHLCRCLEDLKNLYYQANNHLENKQCLPDAIIKTWKNVSKQLKDEIRSIEKRIIQLIENEDSLNEHYKNLQSIPGISKTTSATILAELPNVLAFRNARQLAAYIGVTPKHRLSGSSLKGKSRISKIGSGKLRKALYFPAIVAKKYNPIIKAFCDKLKARGKHSMAIICAAMRKLVHIIYGVLKNKIIFSQEHIYSS